MGTVWHRLGLGCALALVAAAAWASEPTGTPSVDDALDPTAMVTTVSGAYLAGTYAASQDDQAAAAELLLAALARDPDNPRLMRRAFIASVASGMLDRGVDLAETVSAADPEDQLAVMVLLVDDLRGQRYDDALAQLAVVERTGVARYAAPLLEAWIRAGQGDTAAALAALEPLDGVSGFEPVTNVHRAMILDLAGDAEGARAAFEAALAHGDSLRVITAAGAFYERQGKPEEARALYDRFMLANPQSLMLEDALKRLNRGGEAPYLVSNPAEGAAEAMFQMASVVSNESASNIALIYARLALLLRPDFDEVRLLLGDVLSQRHHQDEALAVYRSIDPGTPAGWAARLREAATLGQLERIDEAVALLTAMTQERPDRGEPLIQLGDLHRLEDRFDDAVAAYDQAAERAPAMTDGNWSFFYKRGIALERAHVVDRAVADLEHAISLNGDHAHLLNYLGYLWIDRGENLDEGEALIRRALDLLPNDGYIIDSLGWAQYRIGRYEEAVETLERAVQFRPLDPVINDHLGDAYWRAGRRTEAGFQWSHALIGAEDPELIATLQAKLVRGLDETEDTASSAATE